MLDETRFVRVKVHHVPVVGSGVPVCPGDPVRADCYKSVVEPPSAIGRSQTMNRMMEETERLVLDPAFGFELSGSTQAVLVQSRT